MEITVAVEHRFDQTPDGRVWTQTQYPASFWQRYLDVFSSVRVVARIRQVSQSQPGWILASAPCVNFVALPYYHGPLQFLMRYMQVRRSLAHSIPEKSALILRTPSQVATVLLSIRKHSGRPYGVEVIGDPYEVYASGSSSHPLRFAFQKWYTWQMKRQVAKAQTVAYVSSSVLPARYPADNALFTTVYSSIQLLQNDYAESSRRYPEAKNQWKLLTIGSMDQAYKRIDVIIDAVYTLVSRGIDASLTILGDGKLRPGLQERVQRLGLNARVSFVGQVTAGSSVRQYLDNADIFVLASSTEGLPRAVIEAMARAMPVVATNVGGIPELIAPEDLFAVEDTEALVDKLTSVIGNVDRLNEMSARNFAAANDYKHESLQRKRVNHYEALLRASARGMSDG